MMRMMNNIWGFSKKSNPRNRVRSSGGFVELYAAPYSRTSPAGVRMRWARLVRMPKSWKLRVPTHQSVSDDSIAPTYLDGASIAKSRTKKPGALFPVASDVKLSWNRTRWPAHADTLYTTARHTLVFGRFTSPASVVRSVQPVYPGP